MRGTESSTADRVRPSAVDQPGPAPCATSDPALWFAEHPADLMRAKAICAGCPLRAACLAGALARREPWGVWGGEIVEHGVVLAYKRGRGRPSNTDRLLGLVTRAVQGERRTGPQGRPRRPDPTDDSRRTGPQGRPRPAGRAATVTALRPTTGPGPAAEGTAISGSAAAAAPHRTVTTRGRAGTSRSA